MTTKGNRKRKDDDSDEDVSAGRQQKKSSVAIGVKKNSTDKHTFSKTMTATKKKKKSNPNRKVVVDPNKPKKPPSAFFYFLEDFRKNYREQNPDVKSMREIGKACGEKWNTMLFDEKVVYYDIATEKRAEFDKSMAAYIKKKESGIYSEESDYEYE